MDLFHSWAKPASKMAAEVFAAWIPTVLPLVKPWLSDQQPETLPGIAAGAAWAQRLVDRLRECHGGILFLTPESMVSPWVLVECGALITKGPRERPFCFPYLVGPAYRVADPFGSLQYRTADRGGTLKLLHDLNSAVADVHGIEPVAPADLRERFEAAWPGLEERLAPAVRLAGQRADRFAMYGPAAALITQKELDAAEAERRANLQEAKANAYRSIASLPLRWLQIPDHDRFKEGVLTDLGRVRDLLQQEDLGRVEEMHSYWAPDMEAPDRDGAD